MSAIVFVIGLLLVGGLLFLGASVLMGRGETQPPAELDRSPVELPDDRPVVGDDVRALRISVAVRGYRMTEVDWLLDQFATALDERDAQIAALRAGTAVPPVQAQQAAAEPGPSTSTGSASTGSASTGSTSTGSARTGSTAVGQGARVSEHGQEHGA